jgi:hypothetical protein
MPASCLLRDVAQGPIGRSCPDAPYTVSIGESSDFAASGTDSGLLSPSFEIIKRVQPWQRDVALPMDGPGAFSVNLTLVDKFGLTGSTSAVVSVTWPALLLTLGVTRTANGVRVLATFDDVDDDLVPYLWLYNVTVWTVVSPSGGLLPHTCGLSSVCWLYNLTAMGSYNITASVQLPADIWSGSQSYSSSNCSTCVHVANALYVRAPLQVAAVATGLPGGVIINCSGTTGGAPDLSDLDFGFVVLWPPSATVEAVAGVYGRALITGLVLGEQLVRMREEGSGERME